MVSTIVLPEPLVSTDPVWKSERIVSAAVSIGGLIYSMPAPARHCNILWALQHPEDGIPQSQGFLTNTGRFVGRLEAYIIATSTGQRKVEDFGGRHEAYSEDFW